MVAIELNLATQRLKYYTLPDIHQVQHAIASVMLRLPHELKDLFSSWLENHYPLKAQHVLNRLKEMHEGKLYQSSFGARMRGSGLIMQR